MLTVEQVRSLDEKVRMAVDLIDSLKKENSVLKNKLDEYKQKVDQLEDVVDSFKLDQLEIEEGIKDVLTQLDKLEDQITAPPAPNQPSASIQQETEAEIAEDSEETELSEEDAEVPEVPVSQVVSPAPEYAVAETASVVTESQPESVERSAPELEIF